MKRTSKTKYPVPQDGIRGGVLAFVGGATLLLLAGVWVLKHAPAALSDAAPEVQTAAATPNSPAPPHSPGEPAGTQPDSAEITATQPAASSPPETQAQSPQPEVTQVAPSPTVAPASLAEQARVYESAARARYLLANPMAIGQTAPGTLPRATPNGNSPAASNPNAVAGTNGVQGYRERDRVRREWVQEMRAMRNVAILEGRKNSAVQ